MKVIASVFKMFPSSQNKSVEYSNKRTGANAQKRRIENNSSCKKLKRTYSSVIEEGLKDGCKAFSKLMKG